MECNGKCRKFAPHPDCPLHSQVPAELFKELSQALPEQTIVEKVIQDLQEREEYGTSVYGVPLLRDSSKYDALREAYEEALDLCVYLKLEMERRTPNHSQGRLEIF